MSKSEVNKINEAIFDIIVEQDPNIQAIRKTLDGQIHWLYIDAKTMVDQADFILKNLPDEKARIPFLTKAEVNTLNIRDIKSRARMVGKLIQLAIVKEVKSMPNYIPSPGKSVSEEWLMSKKSAITVVENKYVFTKSFSKMQTLLKNTRDDFNKIINDFVNDVGNTRDSISGGRLKQDVLRASKNTEKFAKAKRAAKRSLKKLDLGHTTGGAAEFAKVAIAYNAEFGISSELKHVAEFVFKTEVQSEYKKNVRATGIKGTQFTTGLILEYRYLNSLSGGAVTSPINELRKFLQDRIKDRLNRLEFRKALVERKGSPPLNLLMERAMINAYLKRVRRIPRRNLRVTLNPEIKGIPNKGKFYTKSKPVKREQKKTFKGRDLAFNWAASTLVSDEDPSENILYWNRGPLHDAIKSHMGKGGAKKKLNYRTGRFARSSEILNFSKKAAQKEILVNMKMFPVYKTFEPGGAQHKPGAPDREPSKIHEHAIRDLFRSAKINQYTKIKVRIQ